MRHQDHCQGDALQTPQSLPVKGDGVRKQSSKWRGPGEEECRKGMGDRESQRGTARPLLGERRKERDRGGTEKGKGQPRHE